MSFEPPDPKQSLLNVSRWAAQQAAEAKSEEDRRYWTTRAEVLARKADPTPHPPAASE